jgi:type IV pilus assembly protein PilA
VMYTVLVLLSIQRAHDMNSTGWLSLIIFVPLAAFVFWFVPGSRGENDYGKPPPPNSTGAILLACLPLPMFFVVGILAAVSIPAYQDYSIRAQVSEGLTLAAGPKAAVVETFERYETAPADRVDAGLSADATDTAGQYVDGVDVTNGTIIVTYGANANELLAGKTLALQPYVMSDESVVWRCGHAAPPGDAVAMSGSVTSSAATQIDARFLPSACRP